MRIKQFQLARSKNNIQMEKFIKQLQKQKQFSLLKFNKVLQQFEIKYKKFELSRMTQNSFKCQELVQTFNRIDTNQQEKLQQSILKASQKQKCVQEPGVQSDLEINKIEEQNNGIQLQQEEKQINEESKLNQQNSVQISSKIQNHLNNINSNPLNNEKAPSCNCKKSKCLKMYCDCFAKGINCRDTCKCSNCQNTKNLLKQKKSDRKDDSEIQISNDSNRNSQKPKQKCCNCKKSFCLKKYCECYHARQACGEACKCVDCKNNGQKYVAQNQPKSKILCDLPPVNPCLKKQNSDMVDSVYGINDKKQQQLIQKKKYKIDEDQIETRIQQILRLVPKQNYQTMLDFLAYCLS